MDRRRHTEKDTEIQTKTDTKKVTWIDTDRHGERHRDSDKDRHGERQRFRQRKTQRFRRRYKDTDKPHTTKLHHLCYPYLSIFIYSNPQFLPRSTRIRSLSTLVSVYPLTRSHIYPHIGLAKIIHTYPYYFIRIHTYASLSTPIHICSHPSTAYPQLSTPIHSLSTTIRSHPHPSID